MTDELAALSFEDAMRELKSIVRQLESGKTNLDDAIKAYERDTLLKRHCETHLAPATAKVEQISVGSDGTVSAAPLDPEKSP